MTFQQPFLRPQPALTFTLVFYHQGQQAARPWPASVYLGENLKAWSTCRKCRAGEAERVQPVSYEIASKYMSQVSSPQP